MNYNWRNKMGREVRMVPKEWDHPRKYDGSFIPLMPREDLKGSQDEWDKNRNEILTGISAYYKTLEEFENDYGGRPDDSEYMPDFGDTAIYYCMYEDVSEGTPISPAFETPEELAHWLADTNASSIANRTASYESWLGTIKQGWALSAICTSKGEAISGVEFNAVSEK